MYTCRYSTDLRLAGWTVLGRRKEKKKLVHMLSSTEWTVYTVHTVHTGIVVHTSCGTSRSDAECKSSVSSASIYVEEVIEDSLVHPISLVQGQKSAVTRFVCDAVLISSECEISALMFPPGV